MDSIQNATPTIMGSDQDHQIETLKYHVHKQAPNMRISLFGRQELHVHSDMLKQHSEFFRKFLDSPDKIPYPIDSDWQYDWVSEIEEDGSWHLVAAENAVSFDNYHL